MLKKKFKKHFHQTNQDKMRIFEEILFFKATFNTKTTTYFITSVRQSRALKLPQESKWQERSDLFLCYT